MILLIIFILLFIFIIIIIKNFSKKEYIFNNNKITIVSGADSTHYKTLIQFLNNIISYKLYITNIIIYDLGLTKEEIENIKSYPIILKKFNYNNYPSFFNIKINAGEYAWKPAIIYEVFQEYDGIIVWMDSGNLITDINVFLKNIETNPLYSSITSYNIKHWTHKGTLKYLNVPDSYLELPNRNGALISLNTYYDFTKNIINEFYDCAKEKQCIAPEGSSRNNHRQDQAVFTILYYKYLNKGDFNRVDTIEGYTIHNDID